MGILGLAERLKRLEVCLHEDWYFAHIIARHPDVWMADAIDQIQRALKEPVEIRTQLNGKLLFVGPKIGKGMLSNG